MPDRSLLARTLIALSCAALLAACAGAAPPAASSPQTEPPAQPTAPPPTVAAEPTPTQPPATPTPAAPTPSDDGAASPVAPTPSPAPAEGSAEITVSDGGYLLGPANLALYTFANDSPGSSSCDGSCADAWPPLTVDESETPTAGEGIAGELDVIERADGSLQVTYDDAPLYYYAGDSEPSDTTGDGLGNVWFLARP